MRASIACLLTYCFLIALAASSVAQIDRDFDHDRVRAAARLGAARLPQVERRWRERIEPRDRAGAVWDALFGYNPPGTAVRLAYLHGWLYSKTRGVEDAVAAAGFLERMADYRELVPEALRGARAEYKDGLPAVPSFFHLADYAEAWWRIRGVSEISAESRAKIEGAIAGSADFIFFFPEWGAHNRAMLRAECLAWAARALPEHPRAQQWRRMGAVLAGDSVGQWEIEDAQIYHPIWLLALLRYADCVGDVTTPVSLQVRYYLDYFAALLAPDGTIPAFGDSWHRSGLDRYYACLEWGAHLLRDPALKAAAHEVYRAWGPADPAAPSLGRAVIFARLDGHIAADLAPRPPSRSSGPVLDDVIGKKTVFRSGTGPGATYLLHNFRDEGDWGLLHRDYLRTNLAVEQEKMHHGASDENSVVLFMDRGSVLLHGPGYRDVAPSGPHGAYRADLFHNRVVARRSRPLNGQDAFEFLKDSGPYRPVRTERIDWARFESGLEYSRTRLTDAKRGYVWDRTIVKPDADPLLVVFDTVRITRPGDWTFARLWATQEVVAKGPGWATGRYRSIGDHQLEPGRALLIVDADSDIIPTDSPLKRHSQNERVLHASRSGAYSAGDVVTFTTILKSIADDDASRPREHVTEIARADAAHGAAVRVGKWRLVVKHDLSRGLHKKNVRPRFNPTTARMTAFGLATDADFLWTREGASATTWGATNLTHLARLPRAGSPQQDSEAALFAARRFNVFQPTGRSDRVGASRWRRWEGAIR